MNRNVYPVTGFHKHRKPLDRESARRELARDIVALNRRMVSRMTKDILRMSRDIIEIAGRGQNNG